MSTPMLDDIAAHGNRFNPIMASGRLARPDEWEKPNWITCADGYRLSVIAGWGAYSTPRPDFGTPDDYPGPYSAVEVMADDVPESWADHDAGGVYSVVPVEMVRELIESHGGEA